MYRRSSNLVTPFQGLGNRKTSNAIPYSTASGSLRRTTSVANVINRPSVVGRPPRSSSAGRSVDARAGRPSNPFGASKVTKDPRPVGDKAYTGLMIRKMVEWLKQRDGPTLTEKDLKAPNKQQFAALFKFLYGFVDESYDCDANHPVGDMLELVKALGYPFALNKSHYASFNSSLSWPHILASLSWLRELVEYGLNFNFEATIFPANDIPANDTIHSAPDCDSLAHSVYLYYCNCFMQQQDGGDNYEEFGQCLLDALGSDRCAARVDELTAENERLKGELQMVESKLEDEDKLKELIEEKRKDIVQLEEYCQQMEKYVRSREQGLEDLEQQVATAEQEVKKLDNEIESKKAVISKQGVKAADFRRIAGKREELAKRVATLEKEKQELEKIRWSHEKLIAEKRETIQAKGDEFMKNMKALVRAAPALRKLKGELEVFPFDPNFLDDVKAHIWPWINDVKKIILDEVTTAEANIGNHRAEYAQLREQLADLEMEYNTLELKIKQRDADIEQSHEKRNAELSRLREDISSLQHRYDSAINQKKLSRAAKEQLQAELKQKLTEARRNRETEEEKLERDFQKTMAVANQHVAEINALEKEQEESTRVMLVKVQKSKK